MLHTTVTTTPDHWDSIAGALINGYAGQFGVSQGHVGVPPGLTNMQWCRKFNWNEADATAVYHGYSQADTNFPLYSGFYLAVAALESLTTGQGGHPRSGAVIVDELDPESFMRMYAFAYWMDYFAHIPAYAPYLERRWGMYIPHYRHVSYNDYSPVLGYVLRGNGILAVESYIGHAAYGQWYLSYGIAGADANLKMALMGHLPAYDNAGYGYSWLHEWRAAANGYDGHPSRALLVPVMKVTDDANGSVFDPDLDHLPAVRLIDRCIWAFKTAGSIWSPPRWQYGENGRASRGGVASYKWDGRSTQSEHVTSTIRDGYWGSSWIHYLDDNNWSVNVQPRFTVSYP